MSAPNPTYDPALALRLARASAEAYTATADIVGRWIGGHVLTRNDGDALIIAFRGSVTPQDFVTDGDCFMSHLTGVGIHAGFSNEISEVMSAIYLWLAAQPKLPLYVTGHSMGAALAILCAWNLREFRSVTAVYTFGQPRVGDAAFCRTYQAALGPRTFRVVNEEDIVPRVPGVLMGYRHCGEQRFFPSFGCWLPVHVTVKNPKLWLLLASDAFGLWQEWAVQKRLALLADHAIGRYLAQLEAIA